MIGRARKYRFLFLFALLSPACTDDTARPGADAAVDGVPFGDGPVDSAPAADAAVDGAPVADAASDQQPMRDGSPADQQLPLDQNLSPDLWLMPDLGPLGDDFALIVPPGSESCALGYVTTGDLPESFARVAQLKLAPHALRLSVNGPLPTVNLVDSLEVGLERRVATSLGPGTITYNFSGSEQWGRHNFVYEQDFDLDGTTVTLWWSIGFDVENGTPLTRTKTVTDLSLFEGAHSIQLRRGGGQPASYFGACKLSGRCHQRSFTLDGQDTLELEICSYCPPRHICKSDPSLMLWARFFSGVAQHEERDPLRLIHTNRHHNWGQDMLVFLGQPVGGIHGIYLGTDAYPSSLFSSATYLDAALQPLRTVTASANNPPRP